MSDNLPWKTWTPDDLAPPQAEFVPMVEPEETIIVGDRMDTDIIAGIQSGTETVLVLTGVTTKEMLKDFPYGPKYIVNGVGEIAE